MAVFVRVPVQERHVFRGHLDEACPRLHQPPRQQTAQAKAAGVVLFIGLFRFLGDVEGIALLGAEQAMRVLDGAQHGLLMEITGQLGYRAALDEFPIALVPGVKTLARHSLRRPHGRDRIGRIRQIERPKFAAEKAAGGERLQLLGFANPFEALANVDEGGNRGIVRTADFGDPGAEVRGSHGLRRYIAAVPMVLVPGMKDVAEVGDDVRPDEGAAVEHPGDVLQPL